MTMRYAHLAPAHQLAAVERLVSSPGAVEGQYGSEPRPNAKIQVPPLLPPDQKGNQRLHVLLLSKLFIVLNLP